MTSRELLAAALLSAAFLALLLAGPGRAGAGSEPEIRGLEIELDDGRVLLSFRLVGAFDDELQRRIDSGLPTGFVFDLRLFRPRKWWFNAGLASSQLQVVAMYNAVTRQYLVNYKHNGSLVESRVIRDPDELRAAMTEFERLPAFRLEGMRQEQRLQVRMRVELGTKTVFFFIPATRATDWVESRKFTYPPEGG